MKKFLNDIRSAENPISGNRKIINTIAILLLGIALGTFSKFLDFRQAELPSVLMAIDGALDVHNFLGRFAIWVLIALCISIYSNSAIRASVNVFAFFAGMVVSYYLYSNYVAGFFPRGIWDIDGIPQGKRISLKKFYDTLLAKDELTQAPKGKDKLFPDGDTVLSCCIYSLYENVIEVLDTYTGIDVMGEFYTTFLRFTKGNAKEKGIVLTPKHVTELFCDIAEFYSDRKFDENHQVLQHNLAFPLNA